MVRRVGRVIALDNDLVYVGEDDEDWEDLFMTRNTGHTSAKSYSEALRGK
jgi:hypothetical protein